MTALARDAFGSYVDLEDPGEPQTGEPRVSVTEQEAELLAYMAHGRTVLEIGTGLGISTRALASTACTVDTIDPCPWVAEHVAIGLPSNVRHFRTLESLPTYPEPFDLVFIDGDHDPAAVMADLDAALHLCPKGVIVAHDSNANHVWHALFAMRNDFTFLDTHHGLGILYVGWTK